MYITSPKTLDYHLARIVFLPYGVDMVGFSSFSLVLLINIILSLALVENRIPQVTIHWQTCFLLFIKRKLLQVPN